VKKTDNYLKRKKKGMISMRAGKVLKIILPAVLELFVYVITKEEEKL